MIIKMMQSSDIRKEGYSAVNEKNKKDKRQLLHLLKNRIPY